MTLPIRSCAPEARRQAFHAGIPSRLVDKADLRRELASRRDAVPPEEREALARAAALQVARVPEWSAARVVGLYVAFRSEISTRPLLELAVREGKSVAAPRVVGDDLHYHLVASFDTLKPGAFGIPEPPPATPVTPDLILVPGLAFDASGARLGYGRGYFDRLLTKFPGASIGLAFDFQVLARLPQDTHDVPVDIVATEARLVRGKKPREA